MIHLSVCIPAVFERFSPDLYDELRRQITAGGLDGQVEILALFDNRQRSLGRKRNDLLSAANGKYVTHLDDDDWIAPSYCADIVEAIVSNHEPGLIAFDSEVTLNGGNPFRVVTAIDANNEPPVQVGGLWQTITRQPWNWCAWRRDLCVAFPDQTNGEDWEWVRRMLIRIHSHVKLDKVLHYYRYNNATSVADGMP